MSEKTAGTGDWLRELVQTPCPDTGALVEEYDQRFRDNPRIWTSGEHDVYVHGVLERYCRCRGRELSGSLLDIGCGNGHTLQYFAAQAGDGLDLAGLDFSPEGIALARERVPQAELACGDFLAWQTPRRFDLAICLGVLEHFEDPRPALRHALSLLEPDGALYVDVPNCLWRGWSGTCEGFRRMGDETSSGQIEWHLRRESWERILREAGAGVLAAIEGPVPWLEFTWLLSPDPGAEALHCPDLEAYCAEEGRRAAPIRRKHLRHLRKMRLKRSLRRGLAAVGLLGFARRFTRKL